MKPDYRLCDRCKVGRLPDDLSFFVATDRTMDAAGSMDDDGQQLDLCHACALNAIQYVLLRPDGAGGRADHEAGRKLLKWVEKKMKGHRSTGRRQG